MVVSAGISAQPYAGAGNAWNTLNWILGFRELGHDVWMIEHISSDACVDLAWNQVPPAESANVAWWNEMVRTFGMESRATLLIDGTAPDLDVLRDFAAEADLFFNPSGHFRSPAVQFPKALKVYQDGDPAFTQIWTECYACDMNFSAHDRFVTVGTRFDSPQRFAPDCGIEWIPTLPPVVLKYWPYRPQERFDRFTSIANWEGYKNVEWREQWFTGKREEYQKLIDFPNRISAPIELAMQVHYHEEELIPYRAGGWTFTEARPICATLDHYASYIGGSSAEFSVAKGGYVLSRGGWFSDRSVCYAAMGKPLVVQDTGVGDLLPRGEGWHPWSTPDEARAACERVIEDFPNQQKAARRLAEEYFDSNKVLSRLLDRL